MKAKQISTKDKGKFTKRYLKEIFALSGTLFSGAFTAIKAADILNAQKDIETISSGIDDIAEVLIDSAKRQHEIINAFYRQGVGKITVWIQYPNPNPRINSTYLLNAPVTLKSGDFETIVGKSGEVTLTAHKLISSWGIHLIPLSSDNASTLMNSANALYNQSLKLEDGYNLLKYVKDFLIKDRDLLQRDLMIGLISTVLYTTILGYYAYKHRDGIKTYLKPHIKSVTRKLDRFYNDMIRIPEAASNFGDHSSILYGIDD